MCIRDSTAVCCSCIYVQTNQLQQDTLFHPRGLTFTWWGCNGLCLWHKPTELAHSSLFCSCVYFCLYGPFNCILLHKFSRQLSLFSHCSSGLISALLVLSAIYRFMTVSFSPNIIPGGWLGSKHKLTNKMHCSKSKPQDESGNHLSKHSSSLDIVTMWAFYFHSLLILIKENVRTKKTTTHSRIFCSLLYLTNMARHFLACYTWPPGAGGGGGATG